MKLNFETLPVECQTLLDFLDLTGRKKLTTKKQFYEHIETQLEHCRKTIEHAKDEEVSNTAYDYISRLVCLKTFIETYTLEE